MTYVTLGCTYKINICYHNRGGVTGALLKPNDCIKVTAKGSNMKALSFFGIFTFSV